MNVLKGRISNCLSLVTVILLLPASVAWAAEDKFSNAAKSSVAAKPLVPSNGGEQNSPPSERVLLVRASAVPLGDNSVMAVSPQEAQRELLVIESGLFRRSLAGPKVLSVPEQGGGCVGSSRSLKPRNYGLCLIRRRLSTVRRI